MATIMRVGVGASLNVLTVAVESGAVVTARSGTKVVTATSVDGIAVLKLQSGTWALVATKDGQTAEDSIIILDEYPVDVRFELHLSDLAEGALVKLNESGTGVNFYLSKHDYESELNGSGRELVVRKDCYNMRAWHSSNVNAWASCSLRSWLNSNYLNMLDSAVREMIGTTKYYYTPGNGDNTVTTRSDSVFQLSVAELGQSLSNVNIEGSALPIATTLQIAYIDGSAVNQWTRSNFTLNTINSWYFNTDGNADAYRCVSTYGSRPIFTLPNTTLVNPEPNSDGSYTLIA